MEEFELELKQAFLEEATQSLDDCEQAFLDLELKGNDPGTLDKLFRLAHNLKGTSRAVGFITFSEFTHYLEDLLSKLKNGHLEITGDVVSLLLECNDFLREMTATLIENIEADIEIDELVLKMKEAVELRGLTVAEDNIDQNPERQIENGGFEQEISESLADSIEALESAGVTAEDDDFQPYDLDSDDNIEAAIDEPISHTVRGETVTLEGEDHFVNQADPQPQEYEPVRVDPKATLKMIEASSNPDQSSSSSATGGERPDSGGGGSGDSGAPRHDDDSSGSSSSGKKRAGVEETIRVHLNRVNSLNNFIGELVIMQTMLVEQADVLENPVLGRTVSQLSKLTKEIHDIAMSLRMIPLKQTFSKLQRIVRDTSRSLDKQVELFIEGGETEVDKTVLEHLSDPLVHIVRNAVDHGLEDSDTRRKIGKPVFGQLTLRAFHRSNYLVIEIEDDGRGLDAQRIREKAVEREIISPEADLSERDLWQFIFHPGFSTKPEVSDISGRGVGLDVVKYNIERLSGHLEVESQPGEGTRFRLMLPLTLAIINGMVASVGGERYIIPTAQIREALTPEKTNVHNGPAGKGEVLHLRGNVIPLYRLDRMLKASRTDHLDPWNSIAVVVDNRTRQFAVLVDDIIGQQQVVIKNLGAEMRKKRGYLGSAILGNGMPALIVDLNDLAA